MTLTFPRSKSASTIIRAVWLLTSCLLVSCGGESESQQRPNFLIIVADDLGYSDMGHMGSEIRTPTLDALAAEGVTLTNFHVAATCSPTRSMLLTGVDTHKAGLGTMGNLADELQEGMPGYEGVLSDGVVTVATLLRDAGYHTYLSGKWHLGAEAGMYPTDRGFERAFGPLQGGASHFSDQLKFFSPNADDKTAPYLEDGEIVNGLPHDFYSSKNFTDTLISQIQDGSADDRPFFAIATYTAPHWPIQVPDDDLDRYQGVYDEGYDVLRARRVEGLKARGIVPADIETPELVPWAKSWESLSAEQRTVEARRMELFASMVENLDANIGRLLGYLKKSGHYDNTVIYFFSDNGAEGNPVNRILDDHEWVERTFDNRLENMGRVNSYVFTGPGWAQASMAPFQLYKTFPSEGGIRTPAIVAGRGISARGRSDAFASVKDVVPTMLDLAGVAQPGPLFQGREVASIEGESMVSMLNGETDRIHDEDYTMGWELFGRRAIRRGDWKIVWMFEPYGEGRWRLFNLATDPAETSDLSTERPQKLAEMITAWDDYATDNRVILPAADSAYALDDLDLWDE